jgi:hypothetical protein
MSVQHPECELDPSMNTLERIHDILGLGFLKTKHGATSSRCSVVVEETTGIYLATCFNCHSKNIHLKPVVEGRVHCYKPMYLLLPSSSLEYLQIHLIYPQYLEFP